MRWFEITNSFWGKGHSSILRLCFYHLFGVKKSCSKKGMTKDGRFGDVFLINLSFDKLKVDTSLNVPKAFVLGPWVQDQGQTSVGQNLRRLLLFAFLIFCQPLLLGPLTLPGPLPSWTEHCRVGEIPLGQGELPRSRPPASGWTWCPAWVRNPCPRDLVVSYWESRALCPLISPFSP